MEQMRGECLPVAEMWQFRRRKGGAGADVSKCPSKSLNRDDLQQGPDWAFPSTGQQAAAVTCHLCLPLPLRPSHSGKFHQESLEEMAESA